MRQDSVKFGSRYRSLIFARALDEAAHRQINGVPNERGNAPSAGDVICEWAEAGYRLQSGIDPDVETGDAIVDKNVRARGGMRKVLHSILDCGRQVLSMMDRGKIDVKILRTCICGMCAGARRFDRIAREWGDRTYMAGYRAGAKASERAPRPKRSTEVPVVDRL